MDVYIRHADKEYKNGCSSSYPLDPGLTETGKVRARTRFEKLLAKHGPPDLLLVSPFRRARETAQVLLSLVEVPLEICPLLGEYLGRHVSFFSSSSLHPDTARHDPILDSTRSQLRERIRLYLLDRSLRPEKTVWVVTHGTLIQLLARELGKEIPHPKFMECFEVTRSSD